MTTNSIQPYKRQGMWVSSYRFYFDSVYKLKDEFLETLSKIKALEKKLRKDHKNMDPETLESYVSNETDELKDTAYRQATSSFLYACMTIEGLINHYGTVRLGEKFYKANLERVGITEKLSIILLMCLGIKVGPKDFLLKETRTLFDKRNSLVHPKTREFDFKRVEDFGNVHPRELGINETIKKMESIINKLNELDPDIHLINMGMET